jgi:hypothetical protein
MPKESKPALIAARIDRVPWWRSALSRLSARRHREHDETLERLARRNMADSVREEDIRAWLAVIETRSRLRQGKSPGS